jgi:hypothetical protein
MGRPTERRFSRVRAARSAKRGIGCKRMFDRAQARRHAIGKSPLRSSRRAQRVKTNATHHQQGNGKRSAAVGLSGA